MTYYVYVTIRNSYEVEAASASEAEMKVREMSCEEILNDSDFRIEGVDKDEDNQ